MKFLYSAITTLPPQDAVYIDLAGSHVGEVKSNKLMTSLMEARQPLDMKMRHAEVSLTKVGRRSLCRCHSNWTFLLRKPCQCCLRTSAHGTSSRQ